MTYLFRTLAIAVCVLFLALSLVVLGLFTVWGLLAG